MMNEYTAFEWENLDNRNDEKWYDLDEDNIVNAMANDDTD